MRRRRIPAPPACSVWLRSALPQAAGKALGEGVGVLPATAALPRATGLRACVWRKMRILPPN